MSDTDARIIVGIIVFGIAAFFFGVFWILRVPKD